MVEVLTLTVAGEALCIASRGLVVLYLTYRHQILTTFRHTCFVTEDCSLVQFTVLTQVHSPTSSFAAMNVAAHVVLLA